MSDYAPIVPLKNFRREWGVLVCASGGFDPLHPGHASYLLEASKLGDMLVVVVNGDGFLERKKGSALMPLQDRCRVVSTIKGVDMVVPFEPADPEDDTVCEALLRIQPDVFAKGGDRVDEATIPEWDTCKANAIKVVSGVGWAKQWSSSDYLGRWDGSFFRRAARRVWFRARSILWTPY